MPNAIVLEVFSESQIELIRATSPASPALMDWATYYPGYIVADSEPTAANGKEQNSTTPTIAATAPTKIKPLVKPVTVADVGCGFGGLLVALAPKLPNELLLGTMKLFPS